MGNQCVDITEGTDQDPCFLSQLCGPNESCFKAKYDPVTQICPGPNDHVCVCEASQGFTRAESGACNKLPVCGPNADTNSAEYRQAALFCGLPTSEFGSGSPASEGFWKSDYSGNS